MGRCGFGAALHLQDSVEGESPGRRAGWPGLARFWQLRGAWTQQGNIILVSVRWGNVTPPAPVALMSDLPFCDNISNIFGRFAGAKLDKKDKNAKWTFRPTKNW